MANAENGRTGPPRVTCTACYTLTCREFRDEIGTRQIEGIDEIVVNENYPEIIFQCPVLREEVTEDYFLWLLGMPILREILREEINEP